jgi:hypothetical protein
MVKGFTAYVTAQTVREELAEEVSRREATTLLRQGGFGAVILESYRGGLVIPEEELRGLRDFFRGEGFETLGGLMPVHGEGFGKPGVGVELRCDFFCYTDEATVLGLEQEIRKLARLFDQVVIDDAFLTSCRCRDCEAARGGRDWGVFRRSLLQGVAGRWMAAAHEENPGVRLTVKFPQYYDRHQRFGYDAEAFPRIFDAVWVGTETRDPSTLAYGYVEPYEGYFNVTWMRACAGAKFEGAWLDYLDCDDRLFQEQAVATHLAAPSRVTVFCYHRALFSSGRIARLGQTAAALEELREAARDPQGVAVIKPPNSDGGRDLFIFDYLGMLGIPCVAHTALRPGTRSAIVTAHAADDPDTAAAMARVLEQCGQVIMTVDALRRFGDNASVLDLFGYDPSGVGAVGTSVTAFELDGLSYETTRPVRLAGDLAPADAAVLAWATVPACEAGAFRIPLVTSKVHSGGGKAMVWNLGTFGHGDFLIEESLNVPTQTDLFRLPKGLLDFLRNSALAPLGFAIKAPSRVASFVFRGHVAFANYNPNPVEVQVSGLPWRSDALRSDSPNTACWGQNLLIAPRSYALIRREEE